MAKVIKFPKIDKKVNSTKAQVDPVPKDTFSEELARNISNLKHTLDLSTDEEAMKVASDFYRKYPMLVEHVRSPEYMLRNRR